jgi:hypothetical protein
MTTLRYPQVAPGYGASVDYLYISLKQARSEVDALKVVTWVIANDKDIKPPIPPGSKPQPVGEFGLEIEFPDRTRFPANVFFIPRVFYPVNLLTATAPVEDVVAPTIEEHGIELLAEKLKRHQARGYTKPKPFYRKLMQRAFKKIKKISEAKFDEVIWRGAIAKPGVIAPKAGAKPRRK